MLGDRPAADFGPTLAHEHIIAGWLGEQWDPARPSRTAMVDEAVRQLVELREGTGITGIVDLTTSDLGRDLPALAEVSRRAGVHVIAATGLYRSTVAYPEYWRLADEQRLAAMLRDEITVGTLSGGIRCGVIKAATVATELNPLETKLLRAAASVAAETGCAVATHTEPEPWRTGNPGLAQVRVLMDGGLDPARVVVGHACNSSNLQDLVDVLETGAAIGFDRVGAAFFQPDPVRADTFAALVAAGYGDRLVLAHDHQAVWRTPLEGRRVTVGTFLHLHAVFLPLLRARGVSERDIHAALVDNPARIFAFRE